MPRRRNHPPRPVSEKHNEELDLEEESSAADVSTSKERKFAPPEPEDLAIAHEFRTLILSRQVQTRPFDFKKFSKCTSVGRLQSYAEREA